MVASANPQPGNPAMTVGEDTPGECAIGSCKKSIPISMLMCRVHWRKVPLSLQRVLLRAWDNAKRTGGVLGNSDYASARDACINHIERHNGHVG